MKVIVQRCREAHVVVAEETVGAIGHGALLLVGIEKGDDDAGVVNQDYNHVRFHCTN